ncbi:hypothetical protein MMC09_002641 [Bachmanniomyces sp. S44760]|nr:hypothetical protein [Bachmanniomyces sp. S44760]
MSTAASSNISWPLNRRRSQRPSWEPETNHHTNGHVNGHAETSNNPPLDSPPGQALEIDPSNLRHGTKSLSGISLRSMLLGISLGLNTSLALLLAYLSNPLWRAPFFLASLSLFHFLEYYTTATYNTPAATISAFLLSQNGMAYNAAHSLALLECILSRTTLVWPTLTQKDFGWPWSWSWHPPILLERKYLILGMLLMVTGQAIRTLAMKQAGQNFNHIVQSDRKAGHQLVTHGIYAILRHPSYFGFFWWALGTQVVLGNSICLLGYVVALSRFFENRIESEHPFSSFPFDLRTTTSKDSSFLS